MWKRTKKEIDVNREEQNKEEGKQISMAAIDWVIKRSEGLSASQQDAFFQWLADDPRHGMEFARCNKGWQSFGLLAEWRPEHSAAPNPDLLEVKHPIRRMASWGMGALALAAAFAIVFNIGFGGLRDGESPVDSHGELDGLRIASSDYVHQVLSDGSEVDMRQDSEILVEYTEGVRLVKLLSGEVHFTVAKNPDRPFIVDMGSTRVHAVGTAFNLSLDTEEVGILVTEGKVRVDHDAPPVLENEDSTLGVQMDRGSDKLGSPDDLRSSFMVSGQQSIIPVNPDPFFEPVVRSLSEEQIEKMLSWKHVLLDFDEAPLSEVVLEFNRRNETQLKIRGDKLKRLPIIASYRSNDIEGFVHLLKTYLNVSVTREIDGTIVLEEG